MKPPYQPDNQTRLPLEHYLGRFREDDPREIAARTGAAFDGRTFILRFLSEERYITWPDFQDAGWTDKERILLLHYLLEGRKAGPSAAFLPYRELPWGEVYDRNFRGRCLMGLARLFGARPEAFRAACEALGGTAVPSSGVACELCVLPGLYLRLYVWEGEDELPSSSQILFSDNFPDAFAAEDRVVLCEIVLRKLRSIAGL